MQSPKVLLIHELHPLRFWLHWPEVGPEHQFCKSISSHSNMQPGLRSIILWDGSFDQYTSEPCGRSDLGRHPYAFKQERKKSAWYGWKVEIWGNYQLVLILPIKIKFPMYSEDKRRLEKGKRIWTVYPNSWKRILTHIHYQKVLKTQMKSETLNL